jgi:hypothetical protein
MELASDKLTEIQRDDWEQLRDMFQEHWPEHRVGYFILDNYIQWSNKNVDFEDLEIWSLNDSWRTNGTYIIMVSTAPFAAQFYGNLAAS